MSANHTDSTTTGVSSWLSDLPSRSDSYTDPHSESRPSRSPSPSNLPTKAHSPRTSPHISSRLRSLKRKRETEDQHQDTPTSPRPSYHPLTRRALREFEANMAPGKATPSKSKGNALAGINTPESSNQKSSEFDINHYPVPQSIGNVRRALENASMRYEDEEAWERYPEFRAMIEELLDIPRGSIISDESHKKANRLIKEKRFMGEDAFHQKVFPALVPTTHHVDSQKRDCEGSIVLSAVDYEEADGLEIALKPHFTKGFVPGKMYGMKSKQLGLTEPRPDKAFGKKRSLFGDSDESGRSLPTFFEAVKSLNTKTDWPFMICEDKLDEPFAEAENQAIRDGAVIVHSRLQLKWYVEGVHYKQPLGVDPDIYCFSLCFGPDFSRIAVHWFEKVIVNNQEKSYFHMTPVGDYFIKQKAGQGLMRSRLHNIWDFGLFKYYNQAEETYQKAVTKWRQQGDSPENVALAEAAAATETTESLEA